MKITSGNTETLVNTSAEKMADELTAQADSFSLIATAPGLVKLPLLVLTSDDGLAPRANALVAAIREQGGKSVQTQHFATDHVWSDSRIALQEKVIAWLKELPGAPTR